MNIDVDKITRLRIDYAFHLISCANTVIISSLDEMESIVLRALSGEFDSGLSI